MKDACRSGWSCVTSDSRKHERPCSPPCTEPNHAHAGDGTQRPLVLRSRCLPRLMRGVRPRKPREGWAEETGGRHYMSNTLCRIVELVRNGDARISAHGYDELAEDGILAREVIEGAGFAAVVGDYPNYAKGPCVLVRQFDRSGCPIHVVWGIPKGQASPAVLVTAYRPDPAQWTEDFLRRKP